MFIGLGQPQGNIQKDFPHGKKNLHFHIVVCIEESIDNVKYKLVIKNIMAPIPNCSLQRTPTIAGLKTMTIWWKDMEKKDRS